MPSGLHAPPCAASLFTPTLCDVNTVPMTHIFHALQREFQGLQREYEELKASTLKSDVEELLVEHNRRVTEHSAKASEVVDAWRAEASGSEGVQDGRER